MDTYFVATRTSFSAASEDATSGRNAHYTVGVASNPLFSLVISLLPVLSRVQRFTLSTAKSAILMRQMQGVDIVEFSASGGLTPSIRARRLSIIGIIR
jgi:hypothetical protein